MADREQRKLERLAASSGDPEAEARLLAERVRAGELARERLELAGYLGDPASVMASSRQGGADVRRPESFGEWVQSLPIQGKRGARAAAWARVLLAVGRALEPVFVGVYGDQLYAQALDRLERCLCRSGVRAQAAERDLREALRDLRYELHPDGWEPIPAEAAMLWFPWFAFSCAIDHESPPLSELAPYARAALYPTEVRDAWTICDGDPPDLERLEAAIEGVFPRADGRLWQLRQAIGAELVPWVLGQGDPVRDRVEARERAS